MRFILTSGWEDGIAHLTQELVHQLTAGRRVLWLVSGGSNIGASVKVMQNVPAKLSQQLTVMPVDERYGPAGHPDSNLAQLLAAGFHSAQATVLPVLAADLSLSETTQRYSALAEQALTASDYAIGQLGIGENGHIAGIFPGSVAASEQTALCIGYTASDYERLTMTPAALKRLDVAYAFAFGVGKHAALEQLHSTASDIEIQPAQILKQIKAAYLYNDQVGD